MIPTFTYHQIAQKVFFGEDILIPSLEKMGLEGERIFIILAKPYPNPVELEQEKLEKMLRDAWKGELGWLIISP